MKKREENLGELIANAVSHGVGFLLAIAALVFCLIISVRNGGTLEIVSSLVYGVSLILLYAMSTLYHSFPKNKMPITNNVFRRLDHSSIYILIAGTYTPYALLAIGGDQGYVVLIVEWVCAIIGVVLKSIWIKKFNYLHLIIFLIMGWFAVLYMGTLIETLTIVGTVLLFAGGISYSVGVIFYVLRFRYGHFVFHIFILIGSISHFFSIVLYVL